MENFYPHKYDATHTVEQVIELPEGTEVSVLGRVMALRYHGKMSFADLVAQGKKIQVSFRVDDLGEEKYKYFKNIVRRGDIIGVSGVIYRTHLGEKTIQVKEFKMLSKAHLSLPDTWYGLSDVEVRFRKRYLDIILNPEVRERFLKRSLYLSAVRDYLRAKGFLEFETPVLQPVYGGAEAKPFITHVNSLNEDWYLQISPELYLKRLIIAGYDKVFTICKNFRNEDIDVTHNPEFTMLELYEVNADYNDMRVLLEDLVCSVAQEIFNTLDFEFLGNKISFKKPWKVITMYDSLKEYAGLDVRKMSDEEIREILSQNAEKEPKFKFLLERYNRGLAIAKIFDVFVQPKLIQPTFVIDYPRETTPLCKVHRGGHPELIERFEAFVCGMEIANSYSELNDPEVQEKLFKEQLERKLQGEEEIHPYDEDFLEALKYGMPPTGGLGVGLDRLFMIFCGVNSIKEVLIWPMMKKKEKKVSDLSGNEPVCKTK
ncbi:MAG: lysine--tRNA ligase [archaeon]